MKLNVSNHSVGLLADNFLDPQVYSKGFVNNKPVFDRNLTFIDHASLSQVSTGDQDCYANSSRHM